MPPDNNMNIKAKYWIIAKTMEILPRKKSGKRFWMQIFRKNIGVRTNGSIVPNRRWYTPCCTTLFLLEFLLSKIILIKNYIKRLSKIITEHQRLSKWHEESGIQGRKGNGQDWPF